MSELRITSVPGLHNDLRKYQTYNGNPFLNKKRKTGNPGQTIIDEQKDPFTDVLDKCCANYDNVYTKKGLKH